MDVLINVLVIVGLLVLGIKYLAYAVTGSVALYSDALESLVNVATALAAFMALEWRSDTSPFDAHLRGEAASVVKRRKP